ncbi:MAG: hypothetical protein QXL43_01830 [Methanolinea sp.]
MRELQVGLDREGGRAPPRGRGTRGAAFPAAEPRADEYPVIRVGNARFLVRTADRALAEELVRVAGMLEGSPRPEVAFTNRLIEYTAQGRLAPWAWQREPSRTG